MRPVYGQAVVGCVTGVKTDNIVVALYVLLLLVLAVFQIGTHTRYGKIFITAIQRGNAVIVTDNKPPIFIKRVLITRWRWGVLYFFMAVNLLSWVDFFKRRKPQKGGLGVATPTRFP